MANNKRKTNLDKLSFEEAIKQLTDIVSKIEQGQIPLQQSITQYEKGMTLINHCRKVLTQAEKKIEKISEQKPKSQ